MAAITPYGSITIVDISDVGELSVQPMSNLPLSVVYTPDDNTFTPNWGTNNLTITPIVYYSGTQLALGTTGLTITWQRQYGAGNWEPITSGETIIDNGKLSVTQNKFSSTSTSLTYIVTAQYQDAASGNTLTAQGQITFTLVKNGSISSDVVITGDSVFKYGTDQQITGATSITLTATTTNCLVTQWQYRNAQGNWIQYPNSGTTATLTVNATDATFVNDKCLVKVITDDNEVFDIHTITKLRDGAAGAGTVSGVLTNDDQMIPFDKEGHGDYSAAVSQVIIYEGGVDVTSGWTISQSKSTGVTIQTSTTSVANDTVAVTNMTVASGTVTFTCQKSGYADIIKTCSVVRVDAGQDGDTPTVYSLSADSLALNRSAGGTLNPANVTFSAYSQTGDAKTSYAGRFKIFENISLAEYDAAATKPSDVYHSTNDESSVTYTPSASATSVLCMLFASGGTTSRLDSQQVVVTNDGQSPIHIVLGNYADVLTCTNANTLRADQTVRIPFGAYKGTTRIAASVASVNLLGVTPTKSDATASGDGYIQWVLPAGTSVANASGTLTLTFTIGAITITEIYSWSRNTAAADGENAVLLQVFTPNGTNVFDESTASITMQATLLDGSTDGTSAVTTWTWAKFANGSYTPVTGATSSLTVTRDTVDSYASYRCTATYGGKNYVAYFSLFDKSDPLQITVFSSLGTQIVNGKGVGALYVKVVRNGVEIDPIKSERFLTANPATATAGDYYYKLDATNKTVTLMKYTTQWVVASDTYTGTYTWSWRDGDGDIITSDSLPTDGKVIYIDDSYITAGEKIIADVQVNI